MRRSFYGYVCSVDILMTGDLCFALNMQQHLQARFGRCFLQPTVIALLLFYCVVLVLLIYFSDISICVDQRLRQYSE